MQTITSVHQRNGSPHTALRFATPARPRPETPAQGNRPGEPRNATMTNQKAVIAIVAFCVLILHGAVLWALFVGLVPHKREMVVPVHLLAQLIEPPRPVVPIPQPPVARQPVVPKPTPAVPKRRVAKPRLAPAATPPAATPPAATPAAQIRPESVPAPEAVMALAAVTATPLASAAPAATPGEKPSVPGQTSTVAAAVPSPPSRPAPAVVELPSSDAHYLQNPRPPYPPLSLRLREQGTVLIDVLVSDLGMASQAKVKTSSGFFRLDNAAVSTVLTWRFVPGKRAGVPQSMWFTVPIAFTIQ